MAIRLSPNDYSALIDKYDTFLFDCDGVLWNGDAIVDKVIDVLAMLRSKNKSIIFVTNNATKSRKDYKKKFDKLGIQAEVEEVFGSAYASAVYISTVLNLPKSSKVYVVGMSGLEHELSEEGITHAGGTDPADNTLETFDLTKFHKDPAVKAVLCGLDTSINYTKLSKAFQYLLDEDVVFLATNMDTTYPGTGGLLPGAGSLTSVLARATKRVPTSIGKPEKVMLDCIKAKHDFDPSRTIMVGDRLDTDIAFGKSGGLATLLVMSGVTTEKTLSSAEASSQPDYVLNSLGDLHVLAL